MRLTNSAHMRIALVAPVAQPVPPPRSGSIETVTALLANGLVARGHEVTLFATGDSVTDAGLHALFPRGYNQDPALWPWELCELLNLAAAVERAERFDVIHYQAEYAPIALAYDRTSPAPVLQTMHHAPTPPEVALWMHYRNAPFVAISSTQAKLMTGLNVVATIHHALDMEAFAFCEASGGYLLFLGRFTEGKGVLVAIEVARRTGRRLVLAAPENAYYRETVAPLVDGQQIVYAGEVGPREKVTLLGGADALIYPIQAAEPFGLVLTEAMACGTPIAALNLGAVPEIVDNGVTGDIFDTVDALIDGLPGVLTIDRKQVRERAEERFGAQRMVDAYVDVYRWLARDR